MFALSITRKIIGFAICSNKIADPSPEAPEMRAADFGAQFVPDLSRMGAPLGPQSPSLHIWAAFKNCFAPIQAPTAPFSAA